MGLGHFTSIENICNILKNGRILPDFELYHLFERQQSRQFPGVYVFPIWEDFAYKTFSTGFSQYVTLVFSLLIIQRNDWHYNIFDQDGAVSYGSYDATYFDENRLRIPHDRPQNNIPSELVFHHDIPLDFVTEMWVENRADYDKLIDEINGCEALSPAEQMYWITLIQIRDVIPPREDNGYLLSALPNIDIDFELEPHYCHVPKSEIVNALDRHGDLPTMRDYQLLLSENCLYDDFTDNKLKRFIALQSADTLSESYKRKERTKRLLGQLHAGNTVFENRSGRLHQTRRTRSPVIPCGRKQRFLRATRCGKDEYTQEEDEEEQEREQARRHRVEQRRKSLEH